MSDDPKNVKLTGLTLASLIEALVRVADVGVPREASEDFAWELWKVLKTLPKDDRG